MITEIAFLNLFLCVALVLAPLMTNKFFLNDSKVYSDAHKISLFVLLIGVALSLNYLSVVWPLFCSFGFFTQSICTDDDWMVNVKVTVLAKKRKKRDA